MILAIAWQEMMYCIYPLSNSGAGLEPIPAKGQIHEKAIERSLQPLYTNIRTTSLFAGEQQSLSEVEAAERLQKVLSIPPHERIRQSLRAITSE
jgi:hypothetical protein